MSMEAVVIRGVSLERDQAKITISGVSDVPGVAAKIFHPISAANIVVDMIVQNVSRTGIADISFTLTKAELAKAKEVLAPLIAEFGGAARLDAEDGIAKLSVVGIGMRSHSGVASEMFQALADAGINIQMISTSEIKTAVIIAEDRIDQAANVVHKAFGLSSIGVGMGGN